MRFLAATSLLAAVAAAQVPTSANSDSTTSTASLPGDIPSHSGIPESETAVSSSANSASDSEGPQTTFTASHKPTSVDFSALGCTQWTTIDGTASPVCLTATVTVDTNVQAGNSEPTPATSSVSSHSAKATSSLVEPPHPPSETSKQATHSSSAEHTSSPSKASSTDSVPIHPTEGPHSDLLTSSTKASSTHPISTHPTVKPPHSGLLTSSSSKAILPPSPSSSRTWMTSTKKHTFSFNLLSTGSGNTHSSVKPSHPSKSHHGTQSIIHSNPPMAGGYTMTKDLTKTVKSTVTVHPTSSTSHRSATTTTTVVTVTASPSKKPHPSRSICEDKTVTTTTTEVTITKHEHSKPSEAYTLFSQLSDGQINDKPVPAPTKNHEQPKSSSLSLHGPPAEVTPRSSSVKPAHPTGHPHHPVPYGPEHPPVTYGHPHHHTLTALGPPSAPAPRPSTLERRSGIQTTSI